MLSYLNFRSVFVSRDVTQYLDTEDIPVYRCICKDTSKTKIVFYYTPSEYTILQLFNKIPEHTDLYEISKNTFLQVKEYYINRYTHLFSHVRIEDVQTGAVYRMRCVYDDNSIDIDQKEEDYLIIKEKIHYFYIENINDKNDIYDFTRTCYIFTFYSQREVLSFALDISSLLSKIRFVCCENCLFDMFIDMIKKSYPECISTIKRYW